MNKTETTVSGVKATLRNNWTGGCTNGRLFTLEVPENAWLVEAYVKTTEGLHKFFVQDGCIKGYYDKWTRTHCPMPHNMAKYHAALKAERERRRATMAPRPYSRPSYKPYRRSHSPVNWRKRDSCPHGKRPKSARRASSPFSSDSSTRAWGPSDPECPPRFETRKQESMHPSDNDSKVKAENISRAPGLRTMRIAVVEPEPLAAASPGEWTEVPQQHEDQPPVTPAATSTPVKVEPELDQEETIGDDEESHNVFKDPPASPVSSPSREETSKGIMSTVPKRETDTWAYSTDLVPPPCAACDNAKEGPCNSCSKLLSDQETLIHEVMIPEEQHRDDIGSQESNLTPAGSLDSIPELVEPVKSEPEGENSSIVLPKLKIKMEDLDLQLAYMRTLHTPGTPPAEKADQKWQFPIKKEEGGNLEDTPNEEGPQWQTVAKMRTSRVNRAKSSPYSKAKLASKRNTDLLLCQMGCPLCLGGHLQDPCPKVSLERLPASNLVSTRFATLANLNKLE